MESSGIQADTLDPLLSINKARVVLGAMKGCKRISYPALVRLVLEEGLVPLNNPFSPGAWAFRRTQLEKWFADYTDPETPRRPMRGPGRPRKTPLIRQKAPAVTGANFRR